jgi:hypothetical protein
VQERVFVLHYATVLLHDAVTRGSIHKYWFTGWTQDSNGFLAVDNLSKRPRYDDIFMRDKIVVPSHVRRGGFSWWGSKNCPEPLIDNR